MEKELISKVTYSFYKKAIDDIFLGYHFKKIISSSELKPPIELFNDHLKRINLFWETQLLGTSLPKASPPFDLISIHKALHIKRGEIGRWITLFNETLNEFKDSKNQIFLEKWSAKVSQFEQVFLRYF